VSDPNPRLRSDASPPPVTYSVSPGRLARVLQTVAVLLALAGVLLGAWSAAVTGRRRRRVAMLGELERALALVREAEHREPPDRRRALGLLARLLGSRNARLAGAADELAWSAPAPTPDALAQLAGRVDEEVNGR
jgi:hypothetical protein